MSFFIYSLLLLVHTISSTLHSFCCFLRFFSCHVLISGNLLMLTRACLSQHPNKNKMKEKKHKDRMKYRKTQVYNTMTATGIFYLIFEVSLVLLACFFLSCQANNFVLHIFYVLSIYRKQVVKKK